MHRDDLRRDVVQWMGKSAEEVVTLSGARRPDPAI
jgi:hypothetical protein